MKELLVNVLFLLVVLLLTQHILEVYKKELTKKVSMTYTFVSSFVAIFFCMTFPLSVHEGFIIDIRVVPFILGSLYGGPIVSVGLYVLTILYRFIIGVDLGFWGTLLNYAIIPLLTFAVHKLFLSSSLKKKLLISLSVVSFQVLFSSFIYAYLFVSNTPLNITLIGGFIKVGCVLLGIVTMERIYFHYEIRKKIIDMEKMEMLSHLSASISHEIRNGLTGAKGFMQLLNESEHDPKKQKYIEFALSELERSEIIIRDFLTFAKPAPEKIEKINMEELIQYTLELTSPLANMNSIEVTKDLSPFWIKGEKKLLQQAFLNMFKNAIEAMPNGGQLDISMSSSDTEVDEIRIKDTGVGMDAEQIERLGKPYFTTKGQKGTGLGMMVAYRVIEELHGEIKVMSSKEKGTAFTITFPKASNVSSMEQKSHI